MLRRLVTCFAAVLALAAFGCKRDTPNPPVQAKAVSPASRAEAPVPSGSAAPVGGSSSGSAAPAAPGAVSRTVGPFTRVQIATSLGLDLEIGPAGPLEITGDRDVAAALLTEVTDGVLTIELPPDSSFSIHDPVVVHARTPELTGLRVTTSAHATVRGLAADVFDVRADTAGHVELAGTCKTLSVRASASAHVDAASLRCEHVTVDASTAAQVRVDASQAVTGHAATAAHVQVSGNPATVSVETETAASVDR